MKLVWCGSPSCPTYWKHSHTILTISTSLFPYYYYYPLLIVKFTNIKSYRWLCKCQTNFSRWFQYSPQILVLFFFFFHILLNLGQDYIIIFPILVFRNFNVLSLCWTHNETVEFKYFIRWQEKPYLHFLKPYI